MLCAPQEIRTFFVTAVTANRRRLFQVESAAELFLTTLRDDREKRRYHLHAFVLMPDHVHLLLTPAENVSLEKAVQYVKGGFSFRLKSKLSVWQRSFSLRRMEDGRDFEAHLNYIHQNPVRAGLCDGPEDYLYSSACRSVEVDPAPRHLSTKAGPEGPPRIQPVTRG
jgi:putative transposase